MRQPPNNYILDLKQADMGGYEFNTQEIDNIIVAWAVAWSSNHGGNEVAIVKERRLIAVGGGPSTVLAVETALERAAKCGHSIQGGFFAADAFFPFSDGPKLLAEGGIIGGVVPAGGKREAEIRSFFSERQMHVIFLPEQFRGFCRH